MSKNMTREILGGLIVAGFIAITIYEVVTGGSNKDFLIGAWIGAFTSVVAFHYGTSRGSEMKTQIMAEKK